MLLHREITNPELAKLLQEIEEKALEVIIAAALEERRFDDAVRQALESERVQQVLEHFARNFDPNRTYPEAQKI